MLSDFEERTLVLLLARGSYCRDLKSGLDYGSI